MVTGKDAPKWRNEGRQSMMMEQCGLRDRSKYGVQAEGTRGSPNGCVWRIREWMRVTS